MKFNKHSTHCTRGFTLIEVMVVIVIIAVLAALIVPKVMSRHGGKTGYWRHRTGAETLQAG
jgi:prepilin-type N-terminal cleavage/methylation domain-containing protein